MIVAHLPAGYLTGRVFTVSGPMLWCAVLGGIFPDLDLIWFYLIDNRSFHHHHYWVHVPGFWILVALVGLPSIRLFRPGWTYGALAFLAAIFVHLLLDNIAGGIKWLWPISDQLFYLVEIPARYSHWVLNFILHPIFLLEVVIWGAAIWMFVLTLRKRKEQDRQCLD